MLRRAQLLAGLAVGVLLIAVSVAPALAPLVPKRAVLASADGKVKTERSSYCVASEGGGGQAGQAMCADYASPEKPPRPRLRVVEGEKLEIRFRHRDGLADRVERASVGLISFDGELPYESVGDPIKAKRAGGSRWTFKLPAAVAEANGLSIFARLESGDASFFAGLRH